MQQTQNTRFYIIGAGMGEPSLLTSYAAEKIASAEQVLAPARLAAWYPRAIACAYHALAQKAIESHAATVALLVSGDAGFFSVSSLLREQLLPHGDVELVCGLSSMQYFCAKVGVPYDNLCVRSLHGREGSIRGAVSYHPRTFVLTGGQQTADAVCRDLCAAGLGNITVHLGERLGSPTEHVETATAATFAAQSCDNLSVLLIDNPHAVNAHEPIYDRMLMRSDITSTRSRVPMTKESVRWVAANQLAVQPRETVWDIGAGTGAVTLELARKASDGMVYAIECNPEAVALLETNRRRLGGYNVQIVEGTAPEALAELPAPDCVFIGGSKGQLRRIIAQVQERNPATRLVITAIALETLHEAQSILTELGFASISVLQLAAAYGKPVGAYTMMTAQNPVFIVSANTQEINTQAAGIPS